MELAIFREPLFMLDIAGDSEIFIIYWLMGFLKKTQFPVVAINSRGSRIALIGELEADEFPMRIRNISQEVGKMKDI
jgi:hypothetical protein